MQIIGAEITCIVGIDRGLIDEEQKIIDKLSVWFKECATYASGLRAPSNKSDYPLWQRFSFQDVIKPPKGSKEPSLLRERNTMTMIT